MNRQWNRGWLWLFLPRVIGGTCIFR
jgi:hypothetical protein